jgi:hypothetical protein
MAVYAIYIQTRLESLNQLTESIREGMVQTRERSEEPTIHIAYAEIEENLCYTCFDSRPNAMLVACRHQGLCSICAARLWHIDRRCPLCQRGVNGVVLLD